MPNDVKRTLNTFQLSHRLKQLRGQRIKKAGHLCEQND